MNEFANGLFVGVILSLLLVVPLMILWNQRETIRGQQRRKQESQELSEAIEEECKMVFLIRTDLEMTKGKVAAQCCHATLAAYKAAMKTNKKWVDQWEDCGQTKVTLKCPDEETMLSLKQTANALGIVAKDIIDAGRTQIASGSRTVLAIGPAPKSLVDIVTGSLKLY